MDEVIIKYVEREDGIQYESPEDINRVLNYIINPEKTYGLFGSIGIHDLENCCNDMLRIRDLNCITEPRNLVHLVVSCREFKILDKNELYQLAFKIGLFYGQCYQVVFGIHFHRDNPNQKNDIHFHYMISTTNYITGKYMTTEHYTPRLFNRHVYALLEEYGVKEYIEIKKLK